MTDFLVFFIRLFFTILTWAILIRILLSWVRMDPYHPIVRILDQITEPVLAPARRIIPPIGGLDFSPVIVIIVLNILERILLQALF
ncbi:MAG: YggT family protein [Anaerolineae bacterium]|nr:YggT family protein [Caldilineales bacterium]MDW8269451.1 YggT family protein [Anaerolineae bacterium]